MSDSVNLFSGLVASPEQVFSLTEQVGPAWDLGETEPADSRLKNACAEMESVFTDILFRSMRATVPKNGLIAESHAEKIYTEMLDKEMATAFSEKGDLGLAEAMYQNMKDAIESAKNHKTNGGPGATINETV